MLDLRYPLMPKGQRINITGFPDKMWENLGTAILEEANQTSGGPAKGIVVRG